uniref:Uncharacterized protein n=1 Tax=Clastoptera arizonana TaxID=38151 RepID=A0A1B6CRK1_9HEMI
MFSFGQLIKKMKEREFRITADNENIIGKEHLVKELNLEIKALQLEKEKKKKQVQLYLQVFSERRVKYNCLMEKKSVWEKLQVANKTQFEEANTLIEGLQEAVFNKHITFCKNIRNFLDQHDLLMITSKFERDSLIQAETDHYSSQDLLEKTASLEESLTKLKQEEEDIKLLNVLKDKLLVESYEGAVVKSLKMTLEDLRNELKENENDILKMNNLIKPKKDLIKKRKTKLRDSLFASSK